MTMRWIRMAALLAVGACSPMSAPPPPSAVVRPDLPARVSDQLSLRKKPVPAEEDIARAAANKLKVKPADDAPGTIHLPAITFRTMDRAEARVEINGEPLSTTPCLLSITPEITFDEKIELPKDDPKADAKYVGGSELEGNPPSKADVYLLTRPARLEQYASVKKDECVVIVEGSLGNRPLRGAPRLGVEGYRYTDCRPLVNPEVDDNSRFHRTTWFERNAH